MSSIVDWYLNQLATYGLLPVVAVETAICVAAWCALGATLHAVERRRIRRGLRRLENYANHPTHRTRKEKP